MPMTVAGTLRRVWLISFLLLGACATAPPVQEMSDARQAIAAAREAGAESLAAERLQQAEALLATAETQLQTGIPSSYWAARKAAIDAKETAFDALLISRDARDRGAAP
jgi:hypothetical protein